MLNFPPHHVGNGLTRSAAMVSPAMSGRDTAINVSVHCKCAIKKVPQAHHNYSLLIIHHSLFIGAVTGRPTFVFPSRGRQLGAAKNSASHLRMARHTRFIPLSRTGQPQKPYPQQPQFATKRTVRKAKLTAENRARKRPEFPGAWRVYSRKVMRLARDATSVPAPPMFTPTSRPR